MCRRCIDSLGVFRLSCPSSSTARCQQLQASSAFISPACGSCFRRATVGLNQVTSLSRGSLERVGGLASSCCQKLIGAEGVARLGFLLMNSKTSGRVSKSAEPQLPPVAAGARLHTLPRLYRFASKRVYSPARPIPPRPKCTACPAYHAGERRRGNRFAITIVYSA